MVLQRSVCDEYGTAAREERSVGVNEENRLTTISLWVVAIRRIPVESRRAETRRRVTNQIRPGIAPRRRHARLAEVAVRT